MKLNWLAILFIIVAALAVPSVSAKIIEEKDGYIVTTCDKSLNLPEAFKSTSRSISQGQTDWYSTSVPAGKTSLYADLNWGDTSDSISLTILAPDSTLGPYYDSADGHIDGRINLRISKSSGIPSGTWWSKIYGEMVNGAQSYTYSASAI
ncbi:peptidase domain-containing protein [Methanolacinia petrolearia DSM 11571]|uniref:Peptidase domain-containing protein n=1 Tax=Methanolacinia petrolearia (strain DSM 11571 / OCM 486 / SEBR 4847) TaxID=679926 RepID=E1RI71_METP4|nr:hypothetical protein [Methanolacinia petrolearia]ADN36536.1 peptidase domain-containing protein [Methanolacinia petrolearia DSM 11571]